MKVTLDLDRDIVIIPDNFFKKISEDNERLKKYGAKPQKGIDRIKRSFGQYAILTMLGWMLCAVILFVILNTISALRKNSVIPYGVGAVTLGGSVALAYAKPRIEWFSGPLAFTWNNRFFESYYSANLFTFPL